jgi:hypothetical protein
MIPDMSVPYSIYGGDDSSNEKTIKFILGHMECSLGVFCLGRPIHCAMIQAHVNARDTVGAVWAIRRSSSCIWQFLRRRHQQIFPRFILHAQRYNPGEQTSPSRQYLIALLLRGTNRS